MERPTSFELCFEDDEILTTPSSRGPLRAIGRRLREPHDLCDEHGDVTTASLLENWIDEAERRTWFLFETCRPDARV
jgi:hypothetical protein